MPCMARFSLISLGVCMLERERTVSQVTQVTGRLPRQGRLRTYASKIRFVKEKRTHASRTAGIRPDEPDWMMELYVKS